MFRGRMPDTTVGTPGLCVTKKILSTVLGARRGRLSVSVFSPAGGRLCHPKSSDTVPGLRLERFWGKRHPLEEGAGVLGALEAFSRAGSCSLPQSGSQGRASAGGGVGGAVRRVGADWRIVYPLPTPAPSENKAAWLWEVAQRLGAAGGGPEKAGSSRHAAGGGNHSSPRQQPRSPAP